MADLNDKDRQEIVAYLDGELAAGEASVVEARLNRDPRAKKEAEALRKAWDLLDYLPKPAPSPSFKNRTMERLTAQRTAQVSAQPGGRRWTRWRAGLSWAAAVLLAAGAGFGLTTYLLNPRGPDGEGAQTQRDVEDPLAGMSADDVQLQLARNLRILENKRLYDSVEDMELLRALESADLFGEED